MNKRLKIISAIISASIALPIFAFANTDANLVSIQISQISGGIRAYSNSSSTYLITATRTGFGDRFADVSVSGLRNVNADFSKNPIEFQSQGPVGQVITATSSLTLTANSGTPRQNVCFTVTATGANTVSTQQCINITGRRSILSIFTDLFVPTAKKVPRVSTINILTGKIGVIR